MEQIPPNRICKRANLACANGVFATQLSAVKSVYFHVFNVFFLPDSAITANFQCMGRALTHRHRCAVETEKPAIRKCSEKTQRSIVRKER